MSGEVLVANCYAPILPGVDRRPGHPPRKRVISVRTGRPLAGGVSKMTQCAGDPSAALRFRTRVDTVLSMASTLRGDPPRPRPTSVQQLSITASQNGMTPNGASAVGTRASRRRPWPSASDAAPAHNGRRTRRAKRLRRVGFATLRAVRARARPLLIKSGAGGDENSVVDGPRGAAIRGSRPPGSQGDRGVARTMCGFRTPSGCYPTLALFIL